MLFFNSSTELKGCVNCPSPWTLVNGICIQYIEETSNLLWSQARSNCQALGADLLDIKFETFFQTAEVLLYSVLKNVNQPLFYVSIYLFYHFSEFSDNN